MCGNVNSNKQAGSGPARGRRKGRENRKKGRKEGNKDKKSNKVRNPEVKSIFLSVEPGSGHKAKIFRNFWKHVFFSRIGPFRIVWRKKILVEKFLVENFLSVEPGSGHKAKIFRISGNMFFSRIGPFRIVWRKKNFFVDFVAGRHEIVPPEPSSGSNISRS